MTIEYKLNKEGDFAVRIVDGVSTGEWCNTQTNQQYLKWLEEGNQPLPAENE